MLSRECIYVTVHTIYNASYPGSFFPPGTLALGDGSDNESYGTKSLLPTNSPQSLQQQQQQAGRHVQSSSTQSLNSQMSQPDIHPFFKAISQCFQIKRRR